jgi:hypothetical protein
MTDLEIGIEIIGTVGDVNPIEHGGGLIIHDTQYNIYRVEYTHGQELRTDDGKLYVYSANLEPDIMEDNLWADADVLLSVCGMEEEELEARSQSNDPVERASVLCEIGHCWGWENLDAYPLVLTEDALKARWDLDD